MDKQTKAKLVFIALCAHSIGFGAVVISKYHICGAIIFTSITSMILGLHIANTFPLRNTTKP